MYDLEDEYAESDIPTTLLRSIAECPTVEVGRALPQDNTSVCVCMTRYTCIIIYLTPMYRRVLFAISFVSSTVGSLISDVS